MKSIIATIIVVYTLLSLAQSVDAVNCNFPRGFDQNGTCVCSPNFAGQNCEFQRKSKLAVFLLSFAFGAFGADRFVLGHTSIAIAKLFLCSLSCLFMIAIRLMAGICITDKTFRSLCVGIFAIMFGLTAFIWWIVDFSLILQDKIFLDGNGVALFIDF